MTQIHKGCLLVLLLVAPSAFAQERAQDITPDDYFTLNSITELAISPDGKQVAYCLATWDSVEDNRRTDLWTVTTDGKEKPARLTFDRANDRKPRWSADSKSLYFPGNRKRAAETKPPFDGTTQVWQIAASGGDPKAATREVGGLSAYDHAATAEVIYFSKDVEHNDDDGFSKLRTKFNQVEYGHGKRKVYRKTSPTYGLGNVTTPTLIHVGGSDERCPPGHSRMLYRALKEYRKVPTELVVYTGEPHGLSKMSNRKAKMEWDLAWFEEYLKAPAK